MSAVVVTLGPRKLSLLDRLRAWWRRPPPYPWSHLQDIEKDGRWSDLVAFTNWLHGADCEFRDTIEWSILDDIALYGLMTDMWDRCARAGQSASELRAAQADGRRQAEEEAREEARAKTPEITVPR